MYNTSSWRQCSREQNAYPGSRAASGLSPILSRRIGSRSAEREMRPTPSGGGGGGAPSNMRSICPVVRPPGTTPASEAHVTGRGAPSAPPVGGHPPVDPKPGAIHCGAPDFYPNCQAEGQTVRHSGVNGVHRIPLETPSGRSPRRLPRNGTPCHSGRGSLRLTRRRRRQGRWAHARDR